MSIPSRLTLSELLSQQNRSFEQMANDVLFANRNALALCTEGCEVDAQGVCQHGFPSFLRGSD